MRKVLVFVCSVLLAACASVDSQVNSPKKSGPVSDALPWSERMSETTIRQFPQAWSMRKSDGVYRWAYTQGLVLKGVYGVYEVNGDQRFANYVQAYVDHYVNAEGTIETYHMDEFNIDSVNSGKLLFPLYRTTQDQRYHEAIELLRKQLNWHPRTSEGVFWHKRKYPWQIWLDGLYMAQPFYAEYAVNFAEPEALDDVISQFAITYEHLFDDKTGLLYHAWDESKIQAWANPETGRSPNFWTRSIGWYAMALVDTLEHIPEQHPNRDTLVNVLEALMKSAVAFQQSNGLWYQVTDQIGREGNYYEASGSLMLIYALAKGVRNGWLPEEYFTFAERGYGGVISQLVTVDKSTGYVMLHSICRSAGLGGNPYRDGSYEYYLSEEVVTNDAHGVGAFILASLEMEAAAKEL